jgi:hypothetical protein
MRTASTASIATITAIALYFAIAWGFSAMQGLVSPSYGLDDVWRSQLIFALGAFFHFGPIGLIKLAAFLAAVKLVAAVVCAIHVVDRARGQPNAQFVEGALILVIAISALYCAPAIWSQQIELFREHTMQLAFAAVALALCTVERALDQRADADAEPVVAEQAYSPF